MGFGVTKGRLEPAFVGMSRWYALWGLPSVGSGRPAIRKVLRHSRQREPVEHRTSTRIRTLSIIKRCGLFITTPK
jgi:hypothetical protein